MTWRGEPLNSFIPIFFTKPSCPRNVGLKRDDSKTKHNQVFWSQEWQPNFEPFGQIIKGQDGFLLPAAPSPLLPHGVDCVSAFTFIHTPHPQRTKKDVGPVLEGFILAVVAMHPGLLTSFRYCSKWILYGAMAHEWLVGSGGLWSGAVNICPFVASGIECVFDFDAHLAVSPLMSLELFQVQNLWILLAYDDC